MLDALASELVQETLGLEEATSAFLRPTTDPKFGDYQINAAMALAKRLKKPPREIASPIADALANHPAVAKAEVAGPGFINIHLDNAWLSAQLTTYLQDESRDGVDATPDPQNIVVDFSSPNIAKQMHVGHLRSTIIGDVIVRLLRFAGHKVIGDNHLGDWGTQFGLLIMGMREFGSEESLERDAIVELERIYKLASARSKEDEAFADAARAELAKLQSGDETNLALWRRFVATTRKSLEQVYARLDVEFDEWLGESAYDSMLANVAESLETQGLARQDQGALCVFWKELEETPKSLRKQDTPFIIRKKDGAYLYSTTDIATVLHRRDHFQADRSIYVVDSRQGLHFKQLFALVGMMGVEMDLEHVGFGTVLGDDGKPLRTRDASGNVTITLNSLLTEAVERAASHIREEGLDIPEEQLQQVARAVGIGAVKYADLQQNRLTDYQFDWDKMISFRGNSGPYLQYAYARIQSIFRKGEIAPTELSSAQIALLDPAEASLGRALMHFPDVVHRAAESCQPHLVCEHLYQVARAFSAFYEACPILKSEGSMRQQRLALAYLTARQMRRGLALLGMHTVDRM